MTPIPARLKLGYSGHQTKTGLIYFRIQNLIPELTNLRLNQKIALKNYNEPLSNMNKQQLNSLSEKQRSSITELVRSEQDLIEFFGYKLH